MYLINIFNPKIRIWSLYIALPSENTVVRVVTMCSVFLYTYVLMWSVTDGGVSKRALYVWRATTGNLQEVAI